MNLGGIRKTLLWSFIAFLSFTALVAVISLIGNTFGETQWKVLGTTFSISSASICAMSCVAFMEKRGQRYFGLPGITFTALAAGLSVNLIWTELDSSFYWKTTGVLIVLSVAFAHALLLQIPTLLPPYQWTQKFSIILIAALALEFIGVICVEDSRDSLWRVIGVTSIFVVLATFVIPICSKLGGNPDETPSGLVLKKVSDDIYADPSGQKFRVTAIEKD